MFRVGDKTLAFSCLFLTLVVMALAQVRDTASLFGTVSDPQSAVIASAKVSITNPSTGLSRSSVSDASGGFVFTLLPVGEYNLTVEQPGFHKYERRGIRLQANENIRVDVGLEVGNVTEAVTVTASAAQVDTRSATLNHTVDSKRIIELPLKRAQPGRPRADGARSDAGRRQYRRSGRLRLASKRPEGSLGQWLP